MKSQAKQLMVSKDKELALLASSAAAGDETAIAMLRDFLLERYPLQQHEFGTFMRVGLPYMVRTVSDYFTGLVGATNRNRGPVGGSFDGYPTWDVS